MTKGKKKSMEGFKHGMKMSLAKVKNDYIRHTINGRYFLARTNMIAEQIHSGEIKENIDGCVKTEEYMRSEYALQKMQAIMEMRNSHFAKKELKEDFKLNDDDIHAIEEDYYNGKIIREEYDDGYNKKSSQKIATHKTSSSVREPQNDLPGRPRNRRVGEVHCS